MSDGDERVVAPPEPRRLPLGRVRRRHQPHPGQRLDEEGADARAALPHDPHPHLQPPPVVHDRPDRRRQQRRGREEEPPVEPQEHPDRPDQECHVPDPRQRRVREHPLDLADVVVDPRHDLAERGPREESRRQTVQVPVQRHAHVEKDLGRDLRVAHPADEVEHKAGQRDRREETDDPHQGVRVLPQQRVINEGAGEEGDVERERGAREVDGQDDGEPALVGREVAEPSPDLCVQYGHSVVSAWGLATPADSIALDSLDAEFVDPQGDEELPVNPAGPGPGTPTGIHGPGIHHQACDPCVARPGVPP